MSINLLIVSALALSSEFKKPLLTFTICSNSATNVAFVFTTFFTFSTFFISFSLTMGNIIGALVDHVNSHSEFI